ncbi:P-loop containing nucleoside triphosphate hydrolase [Lecanosticta acicola]|uniref:P-loop containing nucleoside triphosphate hydrolase n=1 Tax=Lecanosticta acicola TaxID=111012 RepID=A0AAI9EE28_9PEZI|nr:P-loop containing nucleoside triphosphate hydrolase [Lecanosticta acicola]
MYPILAAGCYCTKVLLYSVPLEGRLNRYYRHADPVRPALAICFRRFIREEHPSAVERRCMRSIAVAYRTATARLVRPWIAVSGSFSRTWTSRHKYAAGPKAFGCSVHSQTHSSSVADFTHQDSTIYALSSASGRAAIAVIRISGPACLDIYHQLCPGKKPPKHRTAVVRTLYEPGKEPNREHALDSSALVLYFPMPATATGEDILELHVHGGPAIVKAVLSAISRCESATSCTLRYAEPGEFTRRAFMNGRLDLTQVEALGDTLAADTEQQRRLSVRGASGKLAKHYEAWRQQLLYARGELEALIDFSEDQHFDESPTELCASVAEQVQRLMSALKLHRQNAVRGELLRHGISISLLGAPNAGKSSMLNRIVGREAAIVSNEAGTTRDIVEIGLDLGGYFCRFGDTAGLRQANEEARAGGQPTEVINAIEKEGMRRAKERAADSDLVIVVLSLEEMINQKPSLVFDAEVCTVANHLIREKDNVIIVINKADLIPDTAMQEQAMRDVLGEFPDLSQDKLHVVSCMQQEPSDAERRTGDSSAPSAGIQTFLQGLIGEFARLTAALTPEDDAAVGSDSSVWQESLGASERHRTLLDACVSHLDAFLTETVPPVSQPGEEESAGMREAEAEADIVVAAEHLRAAADCLAKITGRGESGDVEEVLGVVFEKFCVGK